MAGRSGKKFSEVIKRGYSDEELGHIYELGKLHFENGNLTRGAIIMRGILSVAPEFVPALLSMVYVNLQRGNKEEALKAAREAYRINQDSVIVQLFLIAALLSAGDIASAGTHLGEVGELIEQGNVEDVNVVRFYRAQVVRYRSSA